MSTSIGGDNWTRATHRPITTSGAGHQIMPALAFAGGKLALAYYDLRRRRVRRLRRPRHRVRPERVRRVHGLTQPGPLGLRRSSSLCIARRIRTACSRRHTLDLRAAMADALCLRRRHAATFTSYVGAWRQPARCRATSEGRGSAERTARSSCSTTAPTCRSSRRAAFRSSATTSISCRPVFRRRRRRAAGRGIPDRPPTARRRCFTWPGPTTATSARRATPTGRPFTPPVLGPNCVACIPGQAGIRNQDVYTAQLRPGLIAVGAAQFQAHRRPSALVRRRRAATPRDSEHDLPAARAAAGRRDCLVRSVQRLRRTRRRRQRDSSDDVSSVQHSRASRAYRARCSSASSNPPANPNDAPDVLVPVARRRARGRHGRPARSTWCF